MNNTFSRPALYRSLPPDTRIWIYQSDRLLSDDEVAALRQQVFAFSQQWASHNRALRAYGDVLHHCFLLLAVDESQAGASGCSIDSSVHFIRQMGQQFRIDWFNRWRFAWREGEAIALADREAFAEAYREGRINDETLVFNNLVNTKEELERRWLLPLKDSWHSRMV